MPVELPPPPFELHALEPHMSKESMEYHWGKHHRGYVTNLNKAIEGSDMDKMAIEEIVKATWNDGQPTASFNNAAQVWNHTFFWESMKPEGGGEPCGKLLEAINSAFGSFEEFSKLFKTAAVTQFGSGWAWLVSDAAGGLSIAKTPNAETPLASGSGVPVLCCDVWEHAYYVDYRNQRPVYVDTFMEKLVNWDKVSERYAAACS